MDDRDEGPEPARVNWSVPPPPPGNEPATSEAALVFAEPRAPMFGRLFPESLFPRKLDPTAERRIRLAQARAEESVIRAHVAISFACEPTAASR